MKRKILFSQRINHITLKYLNLLQFLQSHNFSKMSKHNQLFNDIKVEIEDKLMSIDYVAIELRDLLDQLERLNNEVMKGGE